MTEPISYVYAAKITPDEDDDLVVTFRDLPEAITDGRDRADALFQGADALEEAIAGRIATGGEIPTPTKPRKGEVLVHLPPVMAAKAALYEAMRSVGMTKTRLAIELGCDEKEVRRLLDPKHASKIGRIQEALTALHLTIEIRVVPLPPAAWRSPAA